MLREKFADGQYEFKVDVYDAQVNKLEDVPLIGNGSTGDISFDIYPYTFKQNKGIKLTPKALKLINLVEYQGNNAAADFTAEDGFTAPVKENPFNEDEII